MTKQNSITSFGLVMLLTAALMSGCSSKKMHSTDDADADADIQAVDAGTDAVPAAGAELAEVPSTDVEAAKDQVNSTPAAPEANPEQLAANPPTPIALDGAPSAVDAVKNEIKPTLGSETPSPELASAPVTPPPVVNGGTETHKVRRGDTLMRIAYEYYGDLYKWKAIYEANRDKIKNPNLISPGIKLTLENASKADRGHHGSRRYKVKAGDSLVKISHKVYGTPNKWKKIWETNKQLIPDPNRVFAGFFVYYSGGLKEPLEDEPAALATPMPVANAVSSSPTVALPLQQTGAEMTRGPASLLMPPPANK